MFAAFRPAAVVLGSLTLLCGVVYPAVITLVAQVVFPAQAGGSLHYEEGRPVGSELLGQSHTDPALFWGRPSATAPVANNGLAGSGSNLGPTNPALLDAVRERCERLRSADPENHAPIPVDLVTTSASGLDPDVSPAAALYQVSRVARASGVPADTLRDLVRTHTELPTLGFLGQPRVNVEQLNRHLRREVGRRSRTVN